jgi:hypothetical protein
MTPEKALYDRSYRKGLKLKKPVWISLEAQSKTAISPLGILRYDYVVAEPFRRHPL